MAASDGCPFDDLPFSQLRQPLNQLSDEQRAQVEAYSVGGFELINEALRGQRPMTEALFESIEILRSAIRKFPLATDARVTREIGASDIGLTSANEAPSTVGRSFVELGFLSTCMSENPPRSPIHAEPLELELRVPAGTYALAAGSLAEFRLELELLVIDAREISVIHCRYNEHTARWRSARFYPKVICHEDGE